MRGTTEDTGGIIPLGTIVPGTMTHGTGAIQASGGTRGSAIRISGGRLIFLTTRTGTIHTMGMVPD